MGAIAQGLTSMKDLKCRPDTPVKRPARETIFRTPRPCCIWRPTVVHAWTRKNGSLMFFVLSVLLSVGFCGMVAAEPVDNAAIKGYDPVAYFTVGKALTGQKAVTVRWHDMTWHFISEENRNLFAAAPEKYAPQYDGYCAWAMTESRKSLTDPELWKIVDGKLYLNCNRAAYEKWSKDIPGNIKKADANWLKLGGGKSSN
jgi:YHS domain-containing protein